MAPAQVAGARDIQDPAIQISVDIARRTVGHEHDLVIDRPAATP